MPGAPRWITCWKDSTFLRKFHAAATIFWICAVLPTLIWWRDSVLWVALMSCWANIASHWAAWQACRVEEKQDEQTGLTGQGRP